MSSSHILIIDDDAEFCRLLSDYLIAEGFDVRMAHDGNAAISALRDHEFDIVILDVMMPEKNGFDTLREMRTFSETPVLMLTARGEEIDRIVGLEMGADDYVGKPCNPREIVARLRAILRRVRNREHRRPSAAGNVVVDGVEIRGAERAVIKDGEPVDLTSTEYDVLWLLVSNAGRVVAKSEVSEQALSRKLGPYDRSIDMHVSRLRRKLGALPDGSERIKTVRGTGYLYVRKANAAASNGR
jgi:two-component system response regulator CpxR